MWVTCCCDVACDVNSVRSSERHSDLHSSGSWCARCTCLHSRPAPTRLCPKNTQTTTITIIKHLLISTEMTRRLLLWKRRQQVRVPVRRCTTCTYLVLTAVDLPFLFRRKTEHGLSMLFVQTQFVLQIHVSPHCLHFQLFISYLQNILRKKSLINEWSGFLTQVTSISMFPLWVHLKKRHSSDSQSNTATPGGGSRNRERRLAEIFVKLQRHLTPQKLTQQSQSLTAFIKLQSSPTFSGDA